MKNIRVFLSQNFQILEVKFSIYLNRRVFIMRYFMQTVSSGAKIVFYGDNLQEISNPVFWEK